MAQMMSFMLAMAAAASQGAGTQGDLPVVTAAPVQAESPQAPLTVRMRPSVMPVTAPPPVYAPPPVFIPAKNPHNPTPVGASDGWITTADYPAEARKAEQTGIAVANLTVAPTGRVTSCAIALSTGFPLLDSATCRLLLARGQFSPAADEAGNPTAGMWSQRARWALPGVLPYPARPQRLDVRITIEADGTQSHCEIIQTEGQLAADRAKLGPMPCSGQKTKPYTDAAGKPVRKILIFSQSVTVADAPPQTGQ